MSKFGAFFLLLTISISMLDTMVFASGNQNEILDPVSRSNFPNIFRKFFPSSTPESQVSLDDECPSTCDRVCSSYRGTPQFPPCARACKKCCYGNGHC